MSTPARFALGFASTGHFLCHGSKLVLPVALALAAADFGVGLVDMAWALTVFGLAMGLASLPAGLLADRYGTTPVLLAFFWLLAAGACLCALSQSYGSFLAAHAVLGVAAGLYHPPGMALISHTASREGLGPALGLHGVAGSLGIALVPLLLGVGWRGAFFVLGAAAAITGLVGWALSRARLLPGATPPPAVVADGVLRRRDLLLFLGVMSVNGFLLDGFSVLFPQAVQARGAAAGSGFSVTGAETTILALGGVGQWVGGLLARGARQRTRYVLLILVQPLLFLATALALRAVNAAPGLALFGLFAFLNYGLQPMENRLLAAYTTSARRSSAYAVKFLLALVVGAAAPPLVVAVAEKQGSAVAFGVLAVCALVGAGLALAFQRAARASARI
ncbi:MAG: MFS transporter [Planctomycetota bacterium]